MYVCLCATRLAFIMAGWVPWPDRLDIAFPLPPSPFRSSYGRAVPCPPRPCFTPPSPPPLQWVFEELAPDLLPLLHQRVRATGAAGWTAAINWALGALPPRGIPAGALLGALRRAPWPADATVLLRRLAATPGVQVGIVSDANAAYIDTILDAAGLGGAGGESSSVRGWPPTGRPCRRRGGSPSCPTRRGGSPTGVGGARPTFARGRS